MGKTTLTGFRIRPPEPSELAPVDELLKTPVFQGKGVYRLAAYAEPGELLVGAVAVKVGGGGDSGIAHFDLEIAGFARRSGVGRQLILRLFEVALSNNCCRLVCSKLLQDKSPAHQFAEALGFSPERTFLRWFLTTAKSLQVTVRVHERYRNRHTQLKDIQFLSLHQADPDAVAQCLFRNYGGYVDSYLRGIKDGTSHPRMSTIAVHNGRVVAASMWHLVPPNFPRLKPIAELRLIVVDPEYQKGPLALCLCWEGSERVQCEGIPDITLEADLKYDTFANSYAKKCKAVSSHSRHRLSISGEAMAKALSLHV